MLVWFSRPLTGGVHCEHTSSYTPQTWSQSCKPADSPPLWSLEETSIINACTKRDIAYCTCWENENKNFKVNIHDWLSPWKPLELIWQHYRQCVFRLQTVNSLMHSNPSIEAKMSCDNLDFTSACAILQFCILSGSNSGLSKQPQKHGNIIQCIM